MPSTAYTQSLHMITATEMPLELLEFQDATMAQPIRLVKDNQPITSNGNIYAPCAFYFSYPSAGDKVQPKASIIIDNIDSEICKLIDQRLGANDVQITVMQVLRETPNIIELRHKFKKIGSVSISKQAISFDLEYLNILDNDAVHITYNKKEAEGVF